MFKPYHELAPVEHELKCTYETLEAVERTLAAERRARNTFAMLALVGWVVALALLGHGGAV